MPIRITTLHGLIAELASRSPAIASLTLATTLSDRSLEDEQCNLANDVSSLDRIARVADLLTANGVPAVALGKMMGDLLSEANFYGQVCEFGVYDWLHIAGATFNPQVHVNGTIILNPNGSDLDGVFEATEVYFDIKAFGFQTYVMETFRKKLERAVGSRHVMINGAADVSAKDVETLAFRQTTSLAAQLSTDGRAEIPQLGWKIRLETGQVALGEQITDPYQVAGHNRYFPFKSARQFARTKPFLLIFGFSHHFNQPLSVNFDDSTSTTLRALARRVFMQMPNDAGLVTAYDRKSSPVSVGEASRLISGLLFVNFGNGDSWCYLVLDDFSHDDY